MTYQLRKLIFLLLFNSSLFFMLMVGIQNSKIKNEVDFLIDKTIKLPNSFIIGTSFICGSIFGGFLLSTIKNKKN